MSDPLRGYFQKNRPPVPPVPSDECERIQGLVQKDKKRRQHRVWYYASAATLAAAGMMAFLNFSPQNTDADAWLEPEDLLYQVEAQDRGAYQDWLWIADQVVDEAGE